MHARRLTVSSLHPESRSRRPRYEPTAPMPFLRLRGRWLDQAGFPIGANVRVQVSAGRLVLEVIDTEPDQR
jgi:toxic protein SymE